MELIAFSVEGYRRFVEKTSVKLVGRLIAFVGPNEAGKSSLLRAISCLHDEDPFQPEDRPRRSDLVPELSWHFKLDSGDKATLADVFDTEELQRIVVARRWQAHDRWSFEPRNPRRDRSHRVPLAEQIEGSRSQLLALGIDANEVDAATELLRSDKNNFSGGEVASLEGLGEACRAGAEEVATQAESEEATTEQQQEAAETSDGMRSLVSLLQETVQLEASPSPYRQAMEALRERLPRFCLFAQEDRDLQSEYDLVVVADGPPPALDHLRSLAELDLPAIRSAAQEGRRADVATWRNAANERLRTIFAESWNQTGVALQVDVDGTTLLIQATTPADDGLSSVAERSDGMRWFAALLAYSHSWSGPTVLLADEIETHLHYDAQADLIDVLLNQTFAEKALYTTHSFGCLPPDLGAGVRVVRPVDAGRSRLENGFWAEGSGFSPLLAGMGAATLSFTPSRRAVIAEGPADAVLLPTLLRQANNEVKLGYLVAPGLSTVAASAAPGLSEEAGRVFFVADSDDGGADLRKMLLDAGVDSSQVFELAPGDSCELEDLVAVRFYVEAVNAEIESWQATDERVAEALFEDTVLRTKHLADWCTERSLVAPDKVAVAQRLVEAAAEETIVDPPKRAQLVRLHSAWIQ